MLIALARRMPEKNFLAVLGFQGKLPLEQGPPNVTYIPFVPDIRTVYAELGILIMPSDYESWGRVGLEAMCSGIPVIAHPTPGLVESLSYAGLFCDRDRVEDWVQTIRSLEDPRFYREVSEKCIRRSRELDPAGSLQSFGNFVNKILNSHPSEKSGG